LVLSCQADYLRPIGTEEQQVSYTFTLYNQTDDILTYVALTDRFDYANFQEAFIFDVRPHELRVVRNVFRPDSVVAKLQWAPHRPSFFLCGSGPDQGSEGSLYLFDSLFVRDSHITHLVLLTGPSGKKPISPFATVSSTQPGPSDGAIGAPIQPDAHLELPSYKPGVPGKNLIPVVVTACSIKGDRALATLFNQTEAVVPVANVVLALYQHSYGASTANLQPFELRQISFKLPSSDWRSADKPAVVFCRPGGKMNGG
jgi:hypothetical protein